MVMKRPDQLVLLALLAVTLLRYIAIAVTPLGLDVEEAQYWLWSQTPDAGYFSKPPMIAWLIGVSTMVLGDTLFGVKAPAPLIQLVSALLIGRVARIAGGDAAGRLAMLVWITLPAGAIAGFVFSTDGPMLLFLLAMLVVLAPLSLGRHLTLQQAGLAGILAGLAMMAKYAAVYLPAGLVLWWLWEGRRARSLSIPHIAVFSLGVLVSMSPNILWNLGHGFVTVAHLEHNANLDAGAPSLLRSLEFLVAQAGVVGPLVFGLAVAAVIAGRREPEARFWIALAAPAIVAIGIQAYLSDANANWAVASWPPLIVLLCRWLAMPRDAGAGRWKPRLGNAAVAVNAALALVVLSASVAGSLGPLTPASDPLRRLKGWQEHGRELGRFMDGHNAGVVVTQRRRDAAKLHWELRGSGHVVEIQDPDGVAENHYEQRHPWRPSGRRIVLVTSEAAPPQLPDVDFAGTSVQSVQRISKKRSRILVFHLGMER